MTQSYCGGCACGAVRYEITGEPVVMVDCQCGQCQRSSGTGHQSHMTFVAAQVHVEGDMTFWLTTGDGGTVKRRGFCPTCGSPVSLDFPAMPDVFIVAPASLDDPSRYKPQLVSWTATGHGWDYLDPALPRFEAMPPR